MSLNFKLSQKEEKVSHKTYKMGFAYTCSRLKKCNKKLISTVQKSLPSLTLPPTKCAIDSNGVWIGKVVEEVLPPQLAAGEEASSVWTG